MLLRLKYSSHQVIEGRKALKYAYAFIYFLSDSSPEKALFENSLEVLEQHIEALSQLTEGEGKDHKEAETGAGVGKARMTLSLSSSSSSSSSSASASASASASPTGRNMIAITNFVTAVYSKHLPGQEATIATTLKKYQGREQELVSELETKYKEPAPAGLFGGAGEGQGQGEVVGKSVTEEQQPQEEEEDDAGEEKKLDRLKCINLTRSLLLSSSLSFLLSLL